jgi:hypothetical protein
MELFFTSGIITAALLALDLLTAPKHPESN